jgi:hypothetical protein
MSHGKLLERRITEAIEAGHYRAKGTPRAKGSESNAAPRAEPEKRVEPSAEEKRSTPDPQSYVQGLARRRIDAVGESVHKALDEKFRGKR